MSKQRYVAEYFTEQAELAAIKQGELDPYSIEYTPVYGDDLESVVNEAKSKNYCSQDECYHVRLEEWDNKYYRWETLERYDCFDLAVVR